MSEQDDYRNTLAYKLHGAVPAHVIIARAEAEEARRGFRDDPPPLEGLTWQQMCAIEPLLADLERRILAVRDDGSAPSFCANRVWAREYKPEICRLVGWSAERWELRSSEAYDFAYERLYALLPPCRNCLCL